ncbi:hypothetical protein B0H11DRAFT_1905067 [Mycena galericulata]|nr:hypothetical protein B0H11DRAFT_1905067 [Mycena galericulata]
MSLTQQELPKHSIKLKDTLFEDNTRDSHPSFLETPHSIRHLPMSPHTHGDYERLRLLLMEESRMKEGLIAENTSLLEDLCKTRRELNNLRHKMQFVGWKLQEEAARRLHGIDSDSSSEDSSEEFGKSSSEDDLEPLGPDQVHGLSGAALPKIKCTPVFRSTSFPA